MIEIGWNALIVIVKKKLGAVSYDMKPQNSSYMRAYPSI